MLPWASRIITSMLTIGTPVIAWLQCILAFFHSINPKFRGGIILPVFKFQSLIVPSWLPLTNILWSELKAIEFTSLECPSKVLSNWPLLRFHSLTTPRVLPLAIFCPSGLIATELTWFNPPLIVRFRLPVSKFHSLIAPSPLPLAIFCPSGVTATTWTWPECPVNRRISLPVVRFHSLTLFCQTGVKPWFVVGWNNVNPSNSPRVTEES